MSDAAPKAPVLALFDASENPRHCSVLAMLDRVREKLADPAAAESAAAVLVVRWDWKDGTGDTRVWAAGLDRVGILGALELGQAHTLRAIFGDE